MQEPLVGMKHPLTGKMAEIRGSHIAIERNRPGEEKRYVNITITDPSVTGAKSYTWIPGGALEL